MSILFLLYLALRRWLAARPPRPLTLYEALQWQLSNARGLPGTAAITLEVRAVLRRHSAGEILRAAGEVRGPWPGRPPHRLLAAVAVADLRLASVLLRKILDCAPAGVTRGQLAADLCSIRSQLAVAEAALHSAH